MSYLQDKKNQRKKYINVGLLILILIIFFFFRNPIYKAMSSTFSVIFRPVLVVSSGVGNKWSGVAAFFSLKSSITKENENLKMKLGAEEARLANYNSLFAENEHLKSILGRKNEKTSLVLSAILSKPNQSAYDTLMIDVGAKQGIKEGNMVFALGNVPIGRINAVYPSSAKVILFSSPGEKTEAIVSIGNIFMTLVGRGGGNFEMILPRDATLPKGTEVVLPGITPYVVAVVQTIITDPRDAFQKALLISPVNIQELKFVEVRI